MKGCEWSIPNARPWPLGLGVDVSLGSALVGVCLDLGPVLVGVGVGHRQ